MTGHREPRTAAEHDTTVGEFARTHVARMCSALPPGPAVEQLQNFCGRGWELLRTPTFDRIYRDALADALTVPEIARSYAAAVYEPLCEGLARIIEQGITEGAFRPIASSAAARVIVSALLQQAFWCNHLAALGPSLEGSCHRVVAETLSLVLGGLTPR